MTKQTKYQKYLSNGYQTLEQFGKNLREMTLEKAKILEQRLQHERQILVNDKY
jgi:hypothetical protein